MRVIKSSLVALFFLFLCPNLVFSAQSQDKTLTATIDQKIQAPEQAVSGIPEQDRSYSREMSVMISDRRWNILPATKVFVGPQNQELTMNELPVPCEAKITYQLTGNNDPNILQIEVLKMLPKATTSWYQPQPE